MVVVAFLFSEKECLVVGKDENIEQRVVVVFLFCLCYLERGHFFMRRPLFFGQNLTTRETPSFLAKMVCVRALFEVSAFSANALQRRREKKLLFVSD